MSDLEDLLRRLSARGELSHLSLAQADGGFAVIYAPVSKPSSGYHTHIDPVCAINLALTGSPGVEPVRRRRRPAIAVGPTTPFDELLG